MQDGASVCGRRSGSIGRLVVGTSLALGGVVATWAGAPYTNFLLRNGHAADHYLPLSALIPVLFAVLVVNPLLRCIRPAWMLRKRDLALLFGVIMAAAWPVSTGYLDKIPYGLEEQAVRATEWRSYYELYQKADLPSSFFPVTMTFEEPNEAAQDFVLRLPPDARIPWGAWKGPALAWGAFAAAWCLLQGGLAALVLPHWRRAERMPFPLLNLYHAFIDRDEGHAWPEAFRQRSFWIAAGCVLAVYTTMVLHRYFPEGIPSIPLRWSLAGMFREEPLRFLPSHFKYVRIHFIALGLAFFMPGRIAVSICFFTLFYGFWQMFAALYAPPFDAGVFRAQGTGAAAALTLSILWLGRRHWAAVGSCLLRPWIMQPHPVRNAVCIGGGAVFFGAALAVFAELSLWWVGLVLAAALLLSWRLHASSCPDDESIRPGIGAFLAGFWGLLAWLLWAGGDGPAALLAAALLTAYALLLMRISAEAGLPAFGLAQQHMVHVFMAFPIRWFSPAAIWLAGAVSMLASRGASFAFGPIALQAFALGEDAGMRRPRRWGMLFVSLAVVGIAASGMAHLHMNYRYAETLDSRPDQPLNQRGANTFAPAGRLLLQHAKDQWGARAFNLPGQIALGGATAAGLQWASLVWPRWMLHPLGFLLANAPYVSGFWHSIFFGWLLRVLLTGFGGAQLCRRARTLVIGLMAGQVLAAVVLFIATLLLAAAGREFHSMDILF